MLIRVRRPNRWMGLGTVTLALWFVALFLLVLYAAYRWGGAGSPGNVLPSAD